MLYLLYARFWHHVLYDLGYTKHPEPFQRLVHQGMILGTDGEKVREITASRPAYRCSEPVSSTTIPDVCSRFSIYSFNAIHERCPKAAATSSTQMML